MIFEVLVPRASTPGRRLAFLMTAFLLGMLGVAFAGAFDPTLTSTVLDTSKYAYQIVGGNETAMSGAPTDVLWTSDTPTGSVPIKFGDTETVGARHLRIAFSSAQTVGTIIVKGNVSVSVLKSVATYPGTLTTEADWTACERVDGTAVTTSQVGLTGVSNEQYSTNEVTTWVVPSGSTSIRAIRFTHVAQQADYGYEGVLKGVYLLAGRYANLATQAQAAATGNNVGASALCNGLDETTSAHPECQYVAPWTNGSNANPITVANSEYVMLVWPSAVSLRGLGVITAGFGAGRVEYFVGSGHPRETSNPADWQPIATNSFVRHYVNNLMGFNRFDFGTTISTRAVRLRITAPLRDESAGSTDGGKKVWMAELLAFKDMSTNALSTAVLTPTGTNAPIPITFTLATAQYVTLVVNDSTGKRVRNLVSEQYFPAGSNTVYWDGMTDTEQVDAVLWNYKTAGKLAGPGTYQVRGLRRDALTLTYEFAVNTGNTTMPWFNRKYTGGWLADHSCPMGICFLSGSSEILIGSPVDELGNGLVWTDLNGNVVYGTRSIGAGGWWYGADHIVRDTGTTLESGVSCYFVATGGETGKDLQFWAVGPNSYRFGYSYPATHSDTTAYNMIASRPSFGGLAVRNQVAAISLNQADKSDNSVYNYGQIKMINATNGSVYSTNNIPNPRGLAFDASGNLLVLSGTSLVRYTVNWAGDKALSGATTLVSGLQDPRGLTVDPENGDMYLTDWGTSQQVKVYTSAGTYVRAIGTAGAPAGLGTYDATHMNYPWGITIANDGQGTKRLWVAEYNWSPKRISVWSLTGTLDTAKTKYGPGAFENGAAIDVSDRTKCYVGGWYGGQTMEYTLDWTNGTATLNRLLSDNALNFPGPWGTSGSKGGGWAIDTNGQKYLVNLFNPGREVFGMPMAGIWRVNGNSAIPVAAVGNAKNWTLICSTTDTTYDSVWAAYGISETTANGVLVSWTDQDNDQQVDANTSELKLKEIGSDENGYPVYVAPDLSVMTSTGRHIALKGYTANNAPIYDVTDGVYTTREFTPTFPIYLANAGQEIIDAANNWRVLTFNPLQGWQSGVQKWTYPSERSGPQEGMNPPIPNGKGEIIGATKILGQPLVPGGSSDLGEVFGLAGSRGQVYLLSTDGLYVGSLFKDTRALPIFAYMSSLSFRSLTASRGMDVTRLTFGDNWFPTMCKTSDGNIYLVGGGEHASIVRLNGLTSAMRMSLSDITVSNAAHTSNANYLITRERERQQNGIGRETLAIGQPLAVPVVDANTNDWANAQWATLHEWLKGIWIGGSVKAALAVDSTNLYVAFVDSAWTPGLDNSGTDWTRLFRTGGAVEVDLGTDTANYTRTSAQAGDLRLLVTRVGATTKATLYRQVKTGGNQVTYTNAAGRSVTMQDVVDVSSSVTLAVNGGTVEFSIPLSTLGFTPVTGNVHFGDLAVLRGKDNGATRETYQRLCWNNEAPGAVYDDPYEVQCYPQVWGRMVVGAEKYVKLTAPTDNLTFDAGSDIVIKADVSSNIRVSKVEFYSGGVKLGEDLNAPYSYTYKSVPWGSYSLTAVATDIDSTRYTSVRPVEISANGGVISCRGLTMWMKGDAISGVSTGNPVATWPDSSGRHNDFVQATASKQASYIADGGTTGHKPLVRFDGTDDWYPFTNRLTDVRTVFWVIKDNHVAGEAGQAFLLGDSSGTDFHRGAYYDFVGPNCAIFSDAYASPLVVQWWANPTITTRLAGAMTDSRYFGVPNTLSIITTRTAGNASAGNFTNDRLNGVVWHGDLAELVIYNRALSDAEIASVEGYLHGKYFTAGGNPPTAAITFPANGASYVTPTDVTITATASDSDGSVSKVEFYNGTTKLGEDTSSPYTFTWTNIGAGTHSLTAKATDNGSGVGISETVTVTATAPTTALVGHWKFNSDVVDSSGHGHLGTFTGGTPSFVTGKFGNGLSCDGVDDFVTGVYGSDLELSTYTISAWVKLTQEPGTYVIASTRYGGDGTFDYKVQSNNIHGDLGDGGSFFCTNADINATDTGSNGQGGDLPLNTWYLVTYVVDNAAQNVKLYIDGDLRNCFQIAKLRKHEHTTRLCHVNVIPVISRMPNGASSHRCCPRRSARRQAAHGPSTSVKSSMPSGTWCAKAAAGGRFRMILASRGRRSPPIFGAGALMAPGNRFMPRYANTSASRRAGTGRPAR